MGQIILKKGTAPTAPDEDKLSIYVKTDGKVYTKDEFGVETLLAGDLTTMLDHEAAANPHPQYILKINLEKVEYRTITPTEITNKYLTLANLPLSAQDVKIDLKFGGGPLFYSEDFVVIGDQISWNGYDLENILEEGDKLRIVYSKMS